MLLWDFKEYRYGTKWSFSDFKKQTHWVKNDSWKHHDNISNLKPESITVFPDLKKQMVSLTVDLVLKTVCMEMWVYPSPGVHLTLTNSFDATFFCNVNFITFLKSIFLHFNRKNLLIQRHE